MGNLVTIQILSDIHVEFHKDHGASFITSLDTSGVDILMLAGDIGDSYTFEHAIKIFSEHYGDAEICFIPGNHEYYGSSIDEVTERCLALELGLPNVKYFDGHVGVREIRGVNVAGCTMWFKDDPQNRFYKNSLNDFSQIAGLEGTVYQINRDDVKFLKSLAGGKADVIFTHHMPSTMSQHHKWQNSNLNRFFVCDITETVSISGAQYWIHGHTHDSCDYALDKTRVICNPFGYTHCPNPDFSDRKLVSIEK